MPTPTPPPSANQAPTLDGVADATLEETTTLTLTLTVGDDATPAANLVVTATSSNAALLPASGVVLAGAGGTRTLTLTPLAEQIGQTTLTVTVSDGDAHHHAYRAPHGGRRAAPAAADGPSRQRDRHRGHADVGRADDGATPTFYVIEGGSAPGLTTLPVIVSPTRVTQWTLKLPAGVYFFRVRAANRAGTSARSNEARWSSRARCRSPDRRRDSPRSSTGCTSCSVGSGQRAAAHPRAGSSSWAPRRGERSRRVRVPPDVTSVGGPLPAGEYFARVRGVNGAGVGPASNEARFRVGDVPACDAPRPPVLLPATVIGRIVTLAWRAPGNVAVGAYRLLVGSAPGGSDLAILDVGPVTSFVAVAPPGVYHVTVLATNACGTSTPSNPIDVSVGVLDPPANLRRPSAARRSRSRGVPSRRPRRTCSRPAPLPASAMPRPSRSSRQDRLNGVPSGTYYVRVRAVASGGATSAPSAEIVVVVP